MPPEQASPTIRGYPIVLATGDEGGVWYGGATTGVGAVDSVDRVDYITPAGALVDIPFPPELFGYWPEAFAPGPSGEEWFLATGEHVPGPLLGEVSPLGVVSARALALPPGGEVGGLATGPEGDLWITDTYKRAGRYVAALFRVSPTGALSAFSRGLRKGAVPGGITEGPDSALWFTDAAGRIGRISTSGDITEYPLPTQMHSHTGAPSWIVAGHEGDLWFTLGPEGLGRMTPSGRVRLFSLPPSRQSPYEAGSAQEQEAGEIVFTPAPTLAIGPEGEVWFTRLSGEVARMDAHGHVTVITNQLVNARGIAFGAEGWAWVGENRASRGTPQRAARVARVNAAGEVLQYPPPSAVCRVPFVMGFGPFHAAASIRDASCEIAHIGRPAGSRSNHLVVVAQSLRPGAVAPYKTAIRLRLGPKLPEPRSCRAPRYTHVLVATSKLWVWKETFGERDDARRLGEGGGAAAERQLERYRACVRPRGPTRTIFRETHEALASDAVEALHAAGHFIAFTSFAENHYNNGDESITVLDIAAGRRVFRKIYGYSLGDYVDNATVADFAVNSDGDVAWVEERHNQARAVVDTLEVHDSTGPHTVEQGAAISSLVFRGRLLSWQSGGQGRSQRVG